MDHNTLKRPFTAKHIDGNHNYSELLNHECLHEKFISYKF